MRTRAVVMVAGLCCAGWWGGGSVPRRGTVEFIGTTITDGYGGVRCGLAVVAP